MRHIFLMVTFVCVCNSGYAKSENKKKPTIEEAILVMTKQVSMTAMLELTKSGTSMEDHKFLIDVYKKAKISLDSKVPYTLNDKKELMINGKVVSFKNKNVFYKNRVMIYNHDKTLSSNVEKFAKQLRSKSSVSFWQSLFIEEVAAQDDPRYTILEEDFAEASAMAMALRHIYNYVEVENAEGYRLKAGMGTDPMIYSALAGAKKTIQSASCKDTDNAAIIADKLGTLQINYKDGSRIDFQVTLNKNREITYRIQTTSSSGETRSGPVVEGQNNAMADLISRFCNSPENVQADYVQGLQDMQLRNADTGGVVIQ